MDKLTLDLELCLHGFYSCNADVIGVEFRTPKKTTYSFEKQLKWSVPLNDDETKSILQRLKEKALEELKKGAGVLEV